MKLLYDNIRINLKQSQESACSGSISSKQRRRAFASDMTGWQAQCFERLILLPKISGQLKELITYLVTMINEARCFKLECWMAYDDLFRNQMAATVTWSSISSSLYAVKFLAKHQSEYPFMSAFTLIILLLFVHCMMHQKRDSRRSLFDRKRRHSRVVSPQWPVCYSWNEGAVQVSPCIPEVQRQAQIKAGLNC